MPAAGERRGAQRVALLLVGANLTVSAASLAQSASAAAQALFDEGRRLLQDGDIPKACTKFAESQRIEPAGGTLMNLGACHAREGRSATAWAEFKDALEQATRDGREDRVQEATSQIQRLEPHLTRLTVVMTAPLGSTPEVRLDGTELGPASWGTPMPVDPGVHQLSAVAPGYVSWSATVSMDPDGESRVLVPALLPSPASSKSTAGRGDGANGAPSAGAPVRDVPPSAGSLRGPATYVLATVGLSAAGAGTAFGLIALSKKNASESECTPAGCTLAGVSLRHDAGTAAWGADIAFGASVACLGAAAYLFFSRPSSSTRPSPRVAPVAGMHSLLIVAGGTW